MKALPLLATCILLLLSGCSLLTSEPSEARRRKLEQDGAPRLIDFGLARLEDQRSALTRTGAAIDTTPFS